MSDKHEVAAPAVTKHYPPERYTVKYPFRTLVEPNDSFLFPCEHSRRTMVAQAMRNASRMQMPGVRFTLRFEYDAGGKFHGVRATRLGDTDNE